ncbi:MAG: cyclophilin-like fold protein [bacterium]|nr:cyclophilin-like fold protein [bacterium]
MKIVFAAESATFEAVLNDSPAAREIARRLPIASEAHTWGDEIYFDTGIDCPRGGETMALEPGDIGYWPRGRSLCVFFGPTPASSGDEPVPAGPVAVIGRTAAPANLLKGIRDGERISVSAA